MNNFGTKSRMTVEERQELAAKLDQELDTFIDSLPKRNVEKSPAYSRWEEELTNHPFFMQDLPQPGSALHPLYEGLQNLKYDPNENESEELALAYKDDGNFHFKHKKYRMAIISYTEGIKINCGDLELQAQLFNNRSAAHYYLKNYRSALSDCKTALQTKEEYDKPLLRAANCCAKLDKYDEAVEFCDIMLEKNINDKEALELRKHSINAKKGQERNRRKKETELRKQHKEEDIMLEELKKRGIRFLLDNLTLSKLEPKFPQLFKSRVSMSEHGSLLWPVIFFYPEYKIMDYVQQFDENSTVMEQLLHIFESFPPWDDEKKYKPENLNVYFENERQQNIMIDVHAPLLDVLKLSGHIIEEGTPKLIILVANSRAERLFLGRS